MEIVLGNPPYNEGTILELGTQDGRYIRILSKEEAEAIAKAAQIVADGWNVTA